MSETLNMKEATIGEVTDFIRDLIEMDIYDPVIILGKMGTGKTASLKSLAKEMHIGYCELRLVNMTETDLIGIPTISAEGTTTYASNDLLPIEERDGEVGILAIDEITSCSSVMRAAAYQLLDCQRRLGNYKLPDKWICVGLGNGPDDGGVFTGAEAALFTRCYGFRVSPNVDCWKEWAIKEGINPAVVAYLSYDPSKLHVYDPDELDGLCPTPRTWEKLSKLLNAKEARNNGKPLPISVAEFLAAASVGEREAGSFSGFYKYTQSNNVLDTEDILSGKANGVDINSYEPQVVYIAIEALINKLGKEIKKAKGSDGMVNEQCLTRVANATNWMISIGRQKLDYGIMAITDVVQGLKKDYTDIVLTDPRFDEKCPELLVFANQNSIIFRN